MAAIHAVMLSTLRTGDELLIPQRGLRRRRGPGAARSWSGPGSRPRAVDTTDPEAVAAAIGERTRLVWLETISNPTTAMADIAASADDRPRAWRDRGGRQHLRLAVPRQPAVARRGRGGPLDHEVHRRPLGHHRRRDPGQRRARSAPRAGSSSTPVATPRRWRPSWHCAASRRLRCGWSATRANALAWPGAGGRARRRRRAATRASSRIAQHELAQRTLRDGMAGGMLSIDLAGGRAAGERFLDRLQVAVHATSLGSVETLCSHPASSSHRQLERGRPGPGRADAGHGPRLHRPGGSRRPRRRPDRGCRALRAYPA